jgi:hypothetical protein
MNADLQLPKVNYKKSYKEELHTCISVCHVSTLEDLFNTTLSVLSLDLWPTDPTNVPVPVES